MDSHPGAAEAAEAAFLAAGHEVVRCRDPHDPGKPCAAYEYSCPLDVGDVDVAVDVRATPLPRATAGEQGVVCASRAGVPVVVAGRITLQPFEALTTREHEGVEGLPEVSVAAVEQAAATDRAVIEAVASQACGRQVFAERRGDELILTVRGAGADEVGRAAVRAHAAARVADPSARSITVRAEA
jgi:hypothetical protein